MYRKVFCCCLLFFCGLVKLSAQSLQIKQNSKDKTVDFGNAVISARLNYSGGAVITSLKANGVELITDKNGIITAQRQAAQTHSSSAAGSDATISIAAGKLTVSGIRYGDVEETWVFENMAQSIVWQINRTQLKSQSASETMSPVFVFRDLNTWEGAYQDYGGLAWFYLFTKPLDTYGVNSSGARFWNTKTGNGLRVKVTAPGQQVAMTYGRTADDKISYRVSVAENTLTPQFDTGTNRRLFLRGSADVWAAQPVNAGKTQQRIELSYYDTRKEFDRGTMKGIDGDKVGAVLNTIARVGVINKKHFGGNSWHTPYGPICLHEQYIAQFGVGINDPDYLKGYQECLDHYRDHAIKPDGRVWSRWAYTNEDMMSGEVNEYGFYEAQWGYLMDSNPDLVTNICELYQQTGDLSWLRTHKASSEKALDWILKRDENNNGLVEMFPQDQKEGKSSDWIDIVWASYENAFVNAKLFRALSLWSALEKQLGDLSKARQYAAAAAKLAVSFNKNTGDGGFWDPVKKCYVHWRDKSGEAHGNNMVTPVNFMAISYGICTDTLRRNGILDDIEKTMVKEDLFFWPLTLTSYEKGELKDWQLPFPNYENGDIFLSWGSVAVDAYASYKPSLALKYIKKVLDQYAKDGLAFQRYGRAAQDGRGDDILAGNGLSVVGLYQSIYGINPMYNRFYLNPRITPELSGTRVNYKFRNQLLNVQLNSNEYAIENNRFRISADHDFGFFASGDTLSFFNHSSDTADLQLVAGNRANAALKITEWQTGKFSWSLESKAGGTIRYIIKTDKSGSSYEIREGNNLISTQKSDQHGMISFSHPIKNAKASIVVTAK